MPIRQAKKNKPKSITAVQRQAFLNCSECQRVMYCGAMFLTQELMDALSISFDLTAGFFHISIEKGFRMFCGNVDELTALRARRNAQRLHCTACWYAFTVAQGVLAKLFCGSLRLLFYQSRTLKALSTKQCFTTAQ